MLQWVNCLTCPPGLWHASSDFDAAPTEETRRLFSSVIISGRVLILVTTVSEFCVLYTVLTTYLDSVNLSIPSFTYIHTNLSFILFWSTYFGAAAIGCKDRSCQKRVRLVNTCLYSIYTHLGILSWGVAIKRWNRHIFTSEPIFIYTMKIDIVPLWCKPVTSSILSEPGSNFYINQWHFPPLTLRSNFLHNCEKP